MGSVADEKRRVVRGRRRHLAVEVRRLDWSMVKMWRCVMIKLVVGSLRNDDRMVVLERYILCVRAMFGTLSTYVSYIL